MTFQTVLDNTPRTPNSGTDTPGCTLRIVIPGTVIGPCSKIRFLIGANDGAHIDGMFVGSSDPDHEAGNFIGPVAVTFGGQPSIDLSAGATSTSDDIDFDFDGIHDLVISAATITGLSNLANKAPVVPNWHEYLYIGDVVGDLTVVGFIDFTTALGGAAASDLVLRIDTEYVAPVIPETPRLSVQRQINEALIAHLKQGSFASPDLELVENDEQAFKPQVGQEYLSARILVTPTNTLYVGDGRLQYSGILQVTVVYPRLSGVNDATGIADRVIDHFKKGTIIDGDGVRVKINRQPSQASPISDGAWLRVPVSIVYNCMA